MTSIDIYQQAAAAAELAADVQRADAGLREARAEAADLDMNRVRGQRNGILASADWTQIGDAALGDHTAEEWATYRQELRDLPAAYSRV